MNISTLFQPVGDVALSGIPPRRFPPFLAVWGGQTEREAAFLNVKLHAARFRVCVGLLADRRAASVNSSRVFSFGFVTAGRPFLPANTGKGQSITRPPPKVCELLVYAIA